MCSSGELPSGDRPVLPWDQSFPPDSPAAAIAMVATGLGWLAGADWTSVPASVQARCLKDLERVASVHTAARASVLAAFSAQGGFEDDGHGSARTWLKWQTRITGSAASAAIASMRRLSAHRVVADALADGRISGSWAREVCDWTDRLPQEHREDAAVILLAAAEGGADLADLESLADQMRRRLARPDSDGDDGFDDRKLRLATTFRGAGRLDGDLTPGCAAALQTVLDALGKRAGPEDTRTVGQRYHDALEEACRRLIAAACLPERAGQPTQIQLLMTLEDLTGIGAACPDAPGSETDRSGTDGVGVAAAGVGRPPSGSGAPWQPGPAAGPGYDCDATIVPVVTGRVDLELLDALTSRLTRTTEQPGPGEPIPGRSVLRDLVLADAVALLSGPGGLASWLRTGSLTGPAASVSLPLDVGAATETIPPHLRRAVILRDRHCAAPGCDQPPAACQAHHIVPRSRGGPTSLENLLLLCSFHHLILIHRWGWSITLNPDGTTTATSPDGRVWHSHPPPASHAA